MQNLPFVWFDLDDTLWDFRENSRISQKLVYEKFGLERRCPSAEIWFDVYEKYNTRLWNRYNVGDITRDYLMEQRFVLPLTEFGFGSEDISHHARMSDFYLSVLGRQPGLVPGAREAVLRMKETGCRVGILSNGFREVQFRKLESSGLDGLFDVIVLSEEIGVNKPDVRLYRYAERKAGITADRCVIIGDNPDTDIAGAIAAGWKAFYLKRDSGAAVVPDGAVLIRSLDNVRPEALFS